MKIATSLWPVDRGSLASLIDLGLSDDQIASYFMVETGDVSRLRGQFKFRREPRPGKLQIRRKVRPTAPLRYELADSLQTMQAEIEALRSCGATGRLSCVVEEAGRQLDEAIALFDRVRQQLSDASAGNVRLRERAAHCRRLASAALSVEIASELDKLAEDYDQEAAQLDFHPSP